MMRELLNVVLVEWLGLLHPTRDRPALKPVFPGLLHAVGEKKSGFSASQEAETLSVSHPSTKGTA